MSKYVDQLRKSNETFKNKVERLELEMTQINKDIERLRKENQEIRNENIRLKNKLDQPTPIQSVLAGTLGMYMDTFAEAFSSGAER